ncbi:MAG: hypothetical protein EP343_10105 [Deltaproteobacteria bacterium]|nr:MAG: hypothetical protein EP343_10105 [Deltaproteobacteria bacterium]
MIRWFVPIGLCLALLSSCGSNHSTESSSGGKEQNAKSIVARVGSSVITKQEFVKEYTKAGQGQSPAQFLKKLINERKLWLAAQEQKLNQAKVVKQTVRKAMVRQLLKTDFEKWYSPNSVDLLQIRHYYKDYYHKYYRPLMARAAHLLVRNPVRPEHVGSLKGIYKAAYPALESEIKQIANEFKALLPKKDPKTQAQFLKIAREFASKYNVPNPQLQTWFKGFSAATEQNKTNKTSLLNAWSEWGKKLNTFAFCGSCAKVAKLMRSNMMQWHRLPTTTIPEPMLQESLTKLKTLVNDPEVRIKVETLPFFPAKQVPGYPAMVNAFAKATHELKDGEYSKELCTTKFGIHLIFRTATQKSFERSFVQVSPEIRSYLFKKNRPKKYKQWLQLKFQKYKPVGYFKRLKEKRRK